MMYGQVWRTNNSRKCSMILRAMVSYCLGQYLWYSSRNPTSFTEVRLQGNCITQPGNSLQAPCQRQLNSRKILPEVAPFRRKTHGPRLNNPGVLPALL